MFGLMKKTTIFIFHGKTTNNFVIAIESRFGGVYAFAISIFNVF